MKVSEFASGSDDQVIGDLFVSVDAMVLCMKWVLLRSPP